MPTIELGAAIVDGELHKEAQVRLPLAMMNRHGLVAGATGTGKTVTLHMMAEQLSDRRASRCSSPTSRATSPGSPRPPPAAKS